MESSYPPVFFGEWVKRRRKALDLTQNELSQRAGCSIFTVRKIESGERRPSKQLAELLANALEISPEEKQTFIRIARGELNLERMQATSLDSTLPPISDFQPDTHLSRIPLQSAPLVGREPELSAMERLFNDPQCRLITLTGMGGIGKTRLALEFASRQQTAFGGGVFYVSLTSIKSPDAIVPVLADAMGFVFSGPADPKEQLLNYIVFQLEQPVLLILDNLEHLLVQDPWEGKTGAAELVSEFLGRLPNAKILATSRERLNLRGEWTYELHGLAVPPVEFSTRLEDYSAVELFVQSARRAKVDFEITDAEVPSVVQICQLLDGIPLALELAAAWVGILSCHEIAQEIDSNIDFLTTTIRDIPARHRSIRASFNHSWNLLSAEEKAALSKLSVFQGGFDRYAAEKIAGASLPLLASLVSKSLIGRAESERYELHEVIRQFASSHLDDEPIRFNTYEIHCEYYLSFTGEREKSLKSAPQQEAVRQLANEIDNIRAAWAWAVQYNKYAQLGQAGRAWGWYFEIAGLYREGIEQLEMLVRALKAEPHASQWHRVLGLALIHQALLYFRKGEFDHAQAHYEEGIATLRPIGDQTLLADALIYLGIITHLNGEYARSKSLLEEGLAFAREGNERWFEAYAIYNLGYIASVMGRYEEALEQMLTGLSIWRAIGDPHSIALGLNYLVTTLNQLGRYQEAKAFMHESIALCEEAKNRWGMGTAYRYLGVATMAEGRFKEAQDHLRKSLEVFGEHIVGWDIARTLSYLGEATMLAGNLSEAREIYMNALRLSVDAKIIPIALDSLLGLARISMQIGAIDRGLGLSDYVLNAPASTQETKDCARQLCMEGNTKLTDQEIETARLWSQNQSIENILDDLLHSGLD
jgi:predicted ATPase/transcriptional regulator with XRE-family HTH domain